jgi:hypothetical protein
MNFDPAGQSNLGPGFRFLPFLWPQLFVGIQLERPTTNPASLTRCSLRRNRDKIC